MSPLISHIPSYRPYYSILPIIEVGLSGHTLGMLIFNYLLHFETHSGGHCGQFCLAF